MNWKTWIPLVLAVGLALVAAKLTHDVIAGKKSGNKEAQGNFVQVVVARGDLAPGAILTKENLTMAPMPGATPPAHTYTSVDDLIDRVATQPLVEGQPINERLLAPKGSGVGLQALVPEGMRAVTVQIDEFTSVANLLAPGMTVDVLGTWRQDAAPHDTTTRTVVQNLKILAVGPRMSAAGDDAKEAYKSVTLLATPRDAERVELAGYSGRPRLVLRNGKDFHPVTSKGASLLEVMTGSDPNSDVKNFITNALAIARSKMPSTQPSVEKVSDVKTEPALDPFKIEAPTQRTVKIIRNGVESSVIFETPRPAKNDMSMTDVPTGSLNDSANGK